VHFIKAKGDIEWGDTSLGMLPAQIGEQLIRGNSQIADATFEKVPGERGFRSDHQLGRLRPASNFTEKRPNPAEILLVRSLLGPDLGYGKAEHVIKLRGKWIEVSGS
jgi:hypothetical protein